MASARLPKLAGTLFTEYNLLTRRKLAAPIGVRTLANAASKSRDEKNEGSDEPLKFSGSKAHTWRAMQSRTGKISDEPWYQTYVVIGSTAAFLIWFGILREESDIDRKFDLTLYDHIEGLEEAQLKIVLKYNQEHNLDTKDIEARLKEIEEYKVEK